MSESYLSTQISSSCTFVCLVSKNTDISPQHFFSQTSMKGPRALFDKVIYDAKDEPRFVSYECHKLWLQMQPQYINYQLALSR